MRARSLLAALALGALTGPALACSYIPDERPWEVRLADEPVIFVGRVIAILDRGDMEAMERGECGPDIEAPLAMGDPDGTCAILRVEQRIRDAPGRTYEVPQGQGADCAIIYDVGQWWLYAGNFIGGPSQQLSGRLSRGRLDAIRRMLR